MIVYKNGVPITELDSPYDLDEWAATYAIPLGELTLDLVEVKQWKADEIRDKADQWYRNNIRSFDGVIITYKRASNQQLTPEESGYRDQMNSAYQTKQNLVQQVRNSTTVEQALAVLWVDPA